MIKCPFCHFENEDGALFCEQCKSDLSGVQPEPVHAVPVEPIPAEPIPAEPIFPEPVLAEAVETAHPFPSFSLDPEPASPVSAIPVEAIPVAPANTPSAVPPELPSTVQYPPVGTPVLLVQRGQKKGVEYEIYDGLNFIGRADEKPVDIDLEDQEPTDRVWCSRQHCCVSWEGGVLAVEDLNSANGTFVNRSRIYPGQKTNLNANDIIQIGNVQLKVVMK